jgi:hypothetical protein
MADVMIDEITTHLEITDTAAVAPDMRRLLDAVMQRLRDEADAAAMRDRDGRISDRSWRSDVKPE